ncbi:hypothetical protein Egran_04932, partial [Elaphomyces granulatus]
MLKEGDVYEDIDQENETTCSLVSEVTKWEKMRQAGQKLLESALTPETLKSYEKGQGADMVSRLEDAVCREYQGNPSISHEVGRYMVRAGEVPMSARSIVEKDLLAFHEKNTKMEVTDWNSEYRELDEVSNWGGPNQQIMMQAIYLIAFTCLLRFDEVLKIQHHHIEVVDEVHGHIRLT